VVNLLTALLASQVRQIGVMKAVGGTRWPIARIYLAQALLLGVAASVVAVPLGMWGSRLLCRYMAVFLNFDIASFAVPAWVYLLEALVGLLVTLLAAAYPVARGTRVSVCEACLRGRGRRFRDDRLRPCSRPPRARRAAAAVAAQRVSPPRATAQPRDTSRRCLLHVGNNVRASPSDHRPTVRLGEVRPSVGLGSLQPLEALSAPARRPVFAGEGWVGTEATLAPWTRRPRARRLQCRTPRDRPPCTARPLSPRIASRSSPCRRDRTSWHPTSSKGAACCRVTRTRCS
jgi:hypothetical protein